MTFMQHQNLTYVKNNTDMHKNDTNFSKIRRTIKYAKFVLRCAIIGLIINLFFLIPIAIINLLALLA